jgi:hypothetical protein
MKKIFSLLAALGGASVALAATGSENPAPDTWKFAASIYCYLPSLGGTTTFPISGGGGDDVTADNVLSKLEFAFMGTLEAHHGKAGAFTDLMYVSFGDQVASSRDISVGPGELPAGTTASTDLSLRGWLWTTAFDYRVLENEGSGLSVFAGARMFQIDSGLQWQLSGNLGSIPLPGRGGSTSAKQIDWDAVIGIRGRETLGSKGKWFIPYYLDVGTGESKLTWQAMLGLGYAFSWGDIAAGWRHIEYSMIQGKPIQDLTLSGGQIGVQFHW